MNDRKSYSAGLIMLGAGRRTLIAAIVCTALWALFFWATSSPGGL